MDTKYSKYCILKTDLDLRKRFIFALVLKYYIRLKLFEYSEQIWYSIQCG